MASFRLGVIFLSLFHGLSSSSGSKILVFGNFCGGSPLLTLISIAEALAERGHQVDIVKWRDLYDYPVNNNPNMSFITLTMDNSNGDWALLTKERHAAFKYPHDRFTLSQGVSRFPTPTTFLLGFEVAQYLQYQCDTLFENKELFNRLRNESYDIAIVDTHINECGMALTHQLKIPIIGYWVPSFASAHPDQTTAFLPASYVPATFSQYGDVMNFFQRTFNLVIKIYGHAAMFFLFYMTNLSIQKYYPGTPFPSELLKNINGMLISSDSSMEYPRLLPPTFINVGGLQIRPLKPLPKEIGDWIESSGDHGVVLIAMGVTHDLNLANKKVVGYFMEAFKKFPQKFLVKYEGVLKNVPTNVKVLKWIPQQDVLGHSKTKAYISHCGVHGVLEGVYYAVPMICMPLGVDHGDMFTRAKERGIALDLHKDTVTTEDIVKQLKEILDNPIYKNNVQKVSAIMRDVKETPRERAVEFIEYMIRQKGAEHLLLASRHLNWFQFYSLDSIAFLFLISFVVMFILNKFMKLTSRIRLPKSRKSDKTD